MDLGLLGSSPRSIWTYLTAIKVLKFLSSSCIALLWFLLPYYGLYCPTVVSIPLLWSLYCLTMVSIALLWSLLPYCGLYWPTTVSIVLLLPYYGLYCSTTVSIALWSLLPCYGLYCPAMVSTALLLNVKAVFRKIACDALALYPEMAWPL